MTFILISGKPKTGKTSVCDKLHDRIAADLSFTVHDKQQSNVSDKEDFMVHYEKCDRHIVLNYPSDSDRCMEQFANYLDVLAQKNVRPEIIITTIREDDYSEDQMSRMFALLEAIGNGTQNLAAHYTSVIMNKQVHTPFAFTSLGHHAFVLHLKEQKNMNAIGLNRYWNYNAETVKQMLDLALARL